MTDELRKLLTADPADTVGIVYEAAKVPDCDHHWISKHQPDFPPPIYWVQVCSQCGLINSAALAEELAAVRRAVLAEVRDQLEQGGQLAAAVFVGRMITKEQQQ